MTFWRDPDAEMKQQREAAQGELELALVRPYALEVLRNILDYLQAIRVEDRMKRSDASIDRFDPGLRLAIERLKKCGETAHAEKMKR